MLLDEVPLGGEKEEEHEDATLLKETLLKMGDLVLVVSYMLLHQD